MAQNVYDPDSDTRADPLSQISPDEEQAMEERARQGAAEDSQQDPQGFFKPNGDDGGNAKTAAAPEENGGEGGGLGGDGLFNKEGDTKGGLRGKLKGKGGLRGALGKNKALVAIGAGGVGLLLLILMLLFLLAAALKIPDLAQHISSYEFARVTRQFSQSAERTTDEELALSATDTGASNSAYSTLKEKYANAKGAVSDTWSKLDKYRPQKVIENLGANNGLTLEFHGNQFVGGTLNDVEFSMKKQGVSKFVPGLSGAISFKNQVSFSRDFSPALTDALKANDIGPIIRGQVAKDIRQRLGIGLIAWQVAKFQGKTPAEARRIEETSKVDAVDGTNPTVSKGATDELNNAEEAAASAEEETLSSNAGIDSVIASGGVVQSVKDAIGKSLANTPLKTVLSFANPAAAITPLCIIYDGSLENSGGPIDSQARQQQAAFYFVESAADQQKNGSQGVDAASGNGLNNAIGATNDDLGDTADSNAELRASTTSTVDTSSAISAEGSADGEFTLLNAIPGMPQSAATIINKAANPLCSSLTNIYAQVGLGIGNILVQFIPGPDLVADGGEAGLEAAGQTVDKVVIQKASDSLASRLITKLGLSKTTSFTSKAGHMLWDTTKDATKIASATVLAKLIVLERSAQLNSGTAQGTDLANEADSGGNIQANEIERTQLFGRPMLESEVCSSNGDDHAFIVAQASKESAFDRYASPSNPSSLLSQTAIALSANVKTSVGQSMLHLASTLFRPASLFDLLGRVFFHNAYADANCSDDSTDYGNVQFGWSDAEQNLANSLDTYKSSLMNQAALDNYPGAEAAIASQYAICFGYTYNSGGDGSFDPTDPNGDLTLAIGPGDAGSIGTLLSKGDIVRDADGNVLDQGLCSPKHLSYNNNDFGPQLVYRWRLAEQYFTTVNQLTNLQDVST